MINKISKSLFRVTMKKEERPKFPLPEMRENITTDPEDIKRIIEGIYKEICGYRLDWLDAKDTFLDRHKFPKLIPEKTGRSMNSPDPDVFTDEFRQTFEEYHPYTNRSLNVGILYNLFYKACMVSDKKYMVIIIFILLHVIFFLTVFKILCFPAVWIWCLGVWCFLGVLLVMYIILSFLWVSWSVAWCFLLFLENSWSSFIRIFLMSHSFCLH